MRRLHTSWHAYTHPPSAGSYAHHAGPHSPKAAHWAWCTIKAHKASCHQTMQAPGTVAARRTQLPHRTCKKYTAAGHIRCSSCAHAGCPTAKAGPQGQTVLHTRCAHCTDMGTAAACAQASKHAKASQDTRCTQYHLQLLDCGKPTAACLIPSAALSQHDMLTHVCPGSTTESNATNPSKRSQPRRPPTSHHHSERSRLASSFYRRTTQA
jgi:hypothetical protein